MDIWLINHYATPIKYHPLARTTNFAKYLMRMGHTVTIFAASSVHNSEINMIMDRSLWREEWVDGIHYVYIRCRSYTGNGFQRILNMFEFPRRLKQVCSQFLQPDVVLASSATPPACMAGINIAKKYGARAVAEVSDLWPLSFVEYGLISVKNPLLIPMYAYEKKMYKAADALIFTMGGGYDYIQEKGWEKDIPHSKVYYINNGVDLEVFDYNLNHYHHEDSDLDNPDIFKVVYTGSIGKANNLGLMLDSAKRVRNPRIRFLIWGDGDELPFLRQRVLDEHIKNVTFKGRVEKKYVPSIVSRADLNYMGGKYSDLFRFGISFNKLFDYFAAGKPAIIPMKANYNPMEEFSCGLTAEREELLPQLLEQAVTLSDAEYQRMCLNARKAAEEYDFNNLTQKLIQILES